MQDRSVVRRLLALFWATTIAGVVLDFALESRLPEPLREYLADEVDEEPGFWFYAGLPFVVACFWLLVSGSLRLAREQAQGGSRFTLGVALSVALTPALGPMVSHAWAAACYEASSVLSGALVACVYLSRPAAPTLESAASAYRPPPIG
jgi:cytochrome c biogenesis protein CcdA